MSFDSVEVKSGPPVGLKPPSFVERLFLVFSTGISEIKRKGSVTRLHFEIKGLEKEKEKYVQALGVRAWEAHISHPDLSGTIVNLKELQIEMNRLKTQFGEHDTQIRDIENSKTELTQKFNEGLDHLEQQIVPHRERIKTVHAEEEDNKIQIEDLRSKQNHLAEQVRLHQQNIQELDLADGAEKESKISLEQEAIRNHYRERTDIDCRLPFLLARVEKCRRTIEQEHAEIERSEQEREKSKRDFERTINDSNHQIRQLEEKKRQLSRQMERYRREMEPYLFELGKKVEQLRLQEILFRENFDQLDGLNREVSTREKQIREAESLSRAMDRTAWTSFLLFSGTTVLLFIGVIIFLFH